MNKALLPLLLCCFIFPASGKDAGWQWYNEKINPKEKENKPVPAAPRQEPDIMQKLAALQTATSGRCTKPFCIPAWIILLNISGCRITGLSRPGFSP